MCAAVGIRIPVVIAIIREFGYRNVCARWVPKILTVEHKPARKKKIFFQPSEEDGIVLVSRITTDEETINGVAPSVVATQEKIHGTGFCG